MSHIGQVGRRARGFTLIELLVAMFIVAIMFAMGYGALRQALENRDRVAARQDRLVALQTAVRVMTQDFAQIEPRPVRDVLGSVLEGALVANPRTVTLATMTRSGWANPAGLNRPTLQRVAYTFDQGKLIRTNWRVLDITQASAPETRELLDAVTAVKLRFMESPGIWLEQWPNPATQAAPNGGPTQLQRLRPLAVEITLQTADFGTLTRLVEVH